MIKETYHFFRYGPRILKLQKELGLANCMQAMAKEIDEDGYNTLRTSLVGDLQGNILEIGGGTGATFPYYGARTHVTAIEPNEEFRIKAEESAKEAKAEIHVLPGTGEKLSFENRAFDAITASMVLCSVSSPLKALEEFKRVLRPGGQIRLMEHVRSEHWLAGPLMDLSNPAWLAINKIGCHWNRRTVQSIQSSGLTIHSIESYKIYSKATPVAFPIRIIKAECPRLNHQLSKHETTNAQNN